MRRMTWSVIVGVVLIAISAALAPAMVGPEVEYRGICNASAAVAIGGDRFIVADDEDSPTTFLRVYRNGQPDRLVDPIALSKEALDLEEDKERNDEYLEVDIEAAAQIGERVYWIGSHSASKKGKSRPNRRRLFATEITTTGDSVHVKLDGKPYKHLIRDLDKDPDYAKFKLKDAADLPPKAAGALSIEGLAATPERDLLIGFRNPVPGGKALIARLKNPKGVTNDKPGSFGPPIQLDLGGRGVRSMEWADSLDAYLIVGGMPGEGPGSQLFLWSGKPTDQPKPVRGVDLVHLNPEALYVDGGSATVLSDDGRREVNGKERDCSPNGPSRSFRGVRIKLD